ncbi:hypothetical protein LCGC14_0625820 [marine sediment metagenome]|uniref:Phage major capsid protein n=1 Tax=marine sediment metagenome TaxID=412755 RepID=A0A0F9UBW1_9ZZZZ
MEIDSYLQLRAALDTTTETTGGDSRTGVGAVFINKEIDRMIVETINRDVDFRPLVQRKSMRQLARIWNLKTSLGGTAKTAFYSDGGTGTPQPNRYLQGVASAKSLRSDYEVTGLTQAASSSYFNALDTESRDALTALALTEEQAFILGDDASSETAGITLNGQIGVTGAYKGLKQLLSSASAVATGDSGGFADASTVYNHTRSSTVTDREFKLNVQTVNTNASATNPVSLPNLDSALTLQSIQGGKAANKIFLCPERRLDKLWQLLQPNGRFVIGASEVALDGGGRMLTYRGVKLVGSRFMTYFGVTSVNGSSVTFTDTDNAMCLLDMDHIYFWNVAGVDARHVPIMGLSTAIRSDVEGGYFKTYGTFTVEKFNTQVVIWNLTAP